MEDLTYIVRTAKAMDKRPVMITLVNDGYYQLAFNWLCHTKTMDIHSQVSIFPCFIHCTLVFSFLFICALSRATTINAKPKRGMKDIC